MSATVSVVIPAFNAAATLGRAIRSALEQTHRPLEILVVDDGSTDATAAIAAGFGAPVRVLRKANGGPASARNLAAREARGDWLAMLDSDDWWLPTKLERQLALDASPRIAIIHSLANSSKDDVPAELSFGQLWEQNWIINSSVLIRRSVFDALGGLDERRDLIAVEDYHLWLRVAHAGWRITLCPEIHVHYTRGIGISWDTDRFVEAALTNVDAIGERLGLPPAWLRRKRLELYEWFGRKALYERNIALARRLLSRAARMRPSPTTLISLGAAHLPSGALDARRRLLERMARRARPADDATERPRLLVVIDAEEEFDWQTVPSSSTSVTSMRCQGLAQRIFQRHGLVPTYAIDYAVASQAEGYEPLLEWLADGTCEVGAQLHPWLNPPIEEGLSEANSFAGNLPEALEHAKIRALTEAIERNLKRRPLLYRAGRYGIGPNTPRILTQLGYRIDCSVRPYYDLTGQSGPDFRHAPNTPHWLGRDGELLELPVTVGMTGWLARAGRWLYPPTASRAGQALHLPGILARLRLLDRVQLTPEGTSLAEAKRLTRRLRRDGHRLFVLSYHSPSLQPGNTPYVRTADDLARFIAWIEAYLAFFFEEIGGVPDTPHGIYERMSPTRRATIDRNSASWPAVVASHENRSA